MGALPAHPRARGHLTDHGGLIVAGGTAQALLASNSERSYFFILNLHATLDLWIDFGVTAVGSQPSIKIPAGANMTFEGAFVPSDSVSLFGGTTGQPFAAKEG